ncbi:hypothetical protein B0H14DRAFT_2683727 [Mycena olivaceomarginata]|nr:hypothetical protein B0H14DRAFT_2683727 [Mycena olivaceomarginata]
MIQNFFSSPSRRSTTCSCMRPPLVTVRATPSSHSGAFSPSRSVRCVPISNMVHAGAVGVVAQDRHLVEEDLSPHLEIVVVQEEVQERAVAGREAFVDDGLDATGTQIGVHPRASRRSGILLDSSGKPCIQSSLSSVFAPILQHPSDCRPCITALSHQKGFQCCARKHRFVSSGHILGSCGINSSS